MSEIEASAQKIFLNSVTGPSSESESQDGPHQANTSRKVQGSQEYSVDEMVQIYHRLQITGGNEMPFHSGGPLTSAHPQKPLSISADTDRDRKFSTHDGANSNIPQRSVSDKSNIYPQWSATGESRHHSTGGWLFDDPWSRRSPSNMNNVPGSSFVGVTSQPNQGTFGGGPALPIAPSAQAASAPSGIALVAPESIQWQYADFDGNIQGPFSGDSMHLWQLSNYFTDDLMLKRVQDVDFVSLGDLKSRVGTAFPFGTSLPQDAWDRAFGVLKLSSGNTLPNQSEVGWSSPWMSRNPSIQEERHFSSVLSGLNLDENVSSPVSEPSDIAPVAQNPIQMQSDVPTPISKPAAIAPSTQAQSQTQSDVPTPISKPSIPSGVQKMSKPTISPEEIYDVTASPELPPQEPELPEEPVVAWTHRPRVQSLSLKEIKELEAARKKAENTSSKQLPASGDVSSRVEVQKAPSERISVNTPAALSVPGSIAPTKDSEGPAWSHRVSTPKLSLKEIKEREAERKKQLQAEEAKRAQLSKSRAQSLFGSAEARPSVNPSPPKWVTAAAPARARPLAEIKQELAAKSTLKKQQRSTPTPVADTSSSLSLGEEAEGWRTAGTTVRRSTSARALQPSHAGSTSSTTILKPASVVDELIQWCRITFKQSLAKDVNHEELLELFLSMPVNSEAKEFIAESIYSYSTVLDGRRFAHDFLERRKKADGELKPGETWKDVLARSNPNIETDPTFKVVSRKKYRPIVHPQ